MGVSPPRPPSGTAPGKYKFLLTNFPVLSDEEQILIGLNTIQISIDRISVITIKTLDDAILQTRRYVSFEVMNTG
jgi:hypothetical protein